MCVGEGERLYLVAGNCFSRREALSESYCSILLERERGGGGVIAGGGYFEGIIRCITVFHYL